MNKPNCKLVKTSYSEDDVIVLLKDLTGQITALDTEEREKLNQSGKHYSEMLPVEYEPTRYYLDLYNEILEMNNDKMAKAIINLAFKIYDKYKYNKNICLVSLARAGTPIGILLKRTIEIISEIKVSHYSISIIRDKGIDVNAMKYICSKEMFSPILFIDGWIGKGAIQRELTKSLVFNIKKIKECRYSAIDEQLYSISDPGFINNENHCGTREDFMIPSACLNATVNGLFSRTIRNELIDESCEFDGAVYYENLEKDDLSMNFINEIMYRIKWLLDINIISGQDVVNKIAKDYNIKDINKIKPGVGETIRVLLRRVPDKILMDLDSQNRPELSPVRQLCREKNIDIEYIEKENYLGNYLCVGIIKEMEEKDL